MVMKKGNKQERPVRKHGLFLLATEEGDAGGVAGGRGVEEVHADEEGIPGIGDVGFVFVGIFDGIEETLGGLVFLEDVAAHLGAGLFEGYF